MGLPNGERTSMMMSFKEVDRLATEGYNMIPVTLSLPSDIITPVSAYLRMRGRSTKSFLFESADGGESIGRYSFMGRNPFANLTFDQSRLHLEIGNHFETIETTTPFDTLSTYLERFKAPIIEGLPPFCGGAVGYVGYDMIRYLEPIPLPGKGYQTHELNLMLFRDIVAFDQLMHKLILISHIDTTETDLKTAYNEAVEHLEELRGQLVGGVPRHDLWHFPLPDAENVDPITFTPLMDRDRYCAAVRKIKRYIKNGDIFQCVLSDRFSFKYETDPLMVYRILRMLNPSPYLFYMELGDEECLLGSSPEMLIRTNGSNIQTCPIAGTRSRGEDNASDLKLEKELLASVKEKAEHLMLVDLGRNDIGRVSQPGSVEVSTFMQVMRYSHVMHLVSTVEGKLKKNIGAWEAFQACFPAGTLSGAPKIRAMEIISELEQQRRGTYGGAVIAYDFNGNLNSCITIRSMHLKEGIGHVQAGAGIVADSRPEKEYDEVLNKSQALKQAVSIASSLTANLTEG